MHGAARGRDRLWRLAAQPPGARAPSPASGHRPRAAPALCRDCCRASRRSACSRRWPAASRWSPAPWHDAEGLFAAGQLPGGPHRRRDDAPAAGGPARPGAAQRAGRQRPRARSAPATPAPIGSTSSLAILAILDAPAAVEAACDAHRLLRLEPRLRLLERCRHLLSRAAARRWPRAATRSPSSSPTRSSGSSIATSPIRTGPRSSSGPPTEAGLAAALDRGRHGRPVVKASGVGVFDARARGRGPGARQGRGRLVVLLGRRCAGHPRRARPTSRTIRLRALIPQLRPGLHLWRRRAGGRGLPSARARAACVPIYNALDPTTHHPVTPDPRFAADLGFLGNRLPDREARVDEFFLDPAAPPADGTVPARRRRLGGRDAAGQRRATSAMSAPPITTRFNCSPLRRAQRQPRQHGRATASRRRPGCSRPRAPAPA